jgi:hypothetical protein
MSPEIGKHELAQVLKLSDLSFGNYQWVSEGDLSNENAVFIEVAITMLLAVFILLTSK